MKKKPLPQAMTFNTKRSIRHKFLPAEELNVRPGTKMNMIFNTPKPKARPPVRRGRQHTQDVIDKQLRGER